MKHAKTQQTSSHQKILANGLRNTPKGNVLIAKRTHVDRADISARQWGAVATPEGPTRAELEELLAEERV